MICLARVTKTVVKKKVKKVSKRISAVKKSADKNKARMKVARAKVKTVKKEAKTAKKEATKAKTELKKAKRVATKAHSVNVRQDAEIEKLKKDILLLQKKKKRPAKHISEYNLFIRKQIKAGLTFTQSAKEWKRYNALQSKNKRRPSAYNQFIGSQMRLGKTFLQSVALWKLAKAGTLGKKGATRTITKTVVHNIKSKPKIKYRTRTITSKPKIKYRTRTITSKPKIKYRNRTKTVTKTIVRRIKSKPTVVIRKILSKPKIRTITKTIKVPSINIADVRQAVESAVSKFSSTSKNVVENIGKPSDEEVAFIVVEAYFKDIARFGMKKELTLDEVINAYLYALARVKRQEIEMSELGNAIKESRMRR